MPAYASMREQAQAESGVMGDAIMGSGIMGNDYQGTGFVLPIGRCGRCGLVFVLDDRTALDIRTTHRCAP